MTRSLAYLRAQARTAREDQPEGCRQTGAVSPLERPDPDRGPDKQRESLRDLIRARAAAQKDLVSIRHQITKFLLRHGNRYRDGRAWTLRFWRWLGQISFEGEYDQFVLDDMVAVHTERLERVARYDEEIEAAAKKPEYAPYVEAMCALRAIDTRSAITKTGNAHVRHIVVQAAWHYQRRITNGAAIQRRRKNQPPELLQIAHRCDQRLNRKFFRMTSRGKRSTVAAVAVVRELVGFIWAIGQVMHT